MKKSLSMFNKVVTLLCIVIVFFSCANNENGFAIKGVKVSSSGWGMMQSFQKKGYKLVHETDNSISMERGVYADNDYSIINIYKGKRGRAYAASLCLLGKSIENRYDALLRDLVSEYGEAQYTKETENTKEHEWYMYEEDELISKMVLYAIIDNELQNQMTEVDLTIYNIRNTRKYAPYAIY